MPKIGVNFAALDALAETLRGATGVIADRLAQLDAEVSELRGAWSGEAADAYAAAQREWTSTIVELNQLLDRSHRTTVTAAGRHRTTEQEVKALWT